MFGTYRFILASMVVLAHLAGPVVDWTGVYAVFSFYLLSGYLMTYILNERYGFTLSGLRRYAINRILRIYPSYWFVLGIAMIVLVTIPEISHRINPLLSMPNNPVEWGHNVFIFGLKFDTHRLIPPAWSVDIELFFYCSMALLFARNRTICSIWFILSLIALYPMLKNKAEWGLRFGSLFGASLPFSTGSMLYYFKNKIPIISPGHIPIALILFMLYASFSNFFWTNPLYFGFYVSFLLSIYLQLSLTNLKESALPSWLMIIDRQLGNLSYPIFLCHWHVGIIIVYLSPFGILDKGMGLFMVGLVVSMLLAWCINRYIEQPIEKIRRKVRAETALMHK